MGLAEPAAFAKKRAKRKGQNKKAAAAKVETESADTDTGNAPPEGGGWAVESDQSEEWVGADTGEKVDTPPEPGAEATPDASGLDDYLDGNPGETEDVETDSGDDSGENDKSPWVFEVFAKETYRFRHASAPTVSPSVIDPSTTSGAQIRRGGDQDLRLYFGGNMRDGGDHFFADLSFGLYADVDGFVSSDDPTALSSMYENDSDMASLYNNSPSAVWFDVYTLFAEYHSRKLLALARGGRQVAEHGRPVTFDGAALRLAVARPYLDIFAFGGRTVHFFETDTSLYEDFLGSGGIVVRPLDFLKFELDYRFLAEDTANDSLLLNGEAAGGTGNVTQHSYGLTGWFRFDDWWFLKAYFRGLDASAAHTGGGTNFEWQTIELGLDVTVDAQLVTLGEVNELDDPYYAVLGESLPHLRLHADLWKSFTTDAGIFTTHAGWAARMLLKDDPTRFNRDYGRAYLAFQAADLGVEGPFVSVTGEMYYTNKGSTPDDDRFFTAGGSLGYETDFIKGEAGTYYQWVKYTYYRDVNELLNVRTYFAELRVKPVEWFGIRLKYEFEQFDRNIHTALVTLTQMY